MRRSTVTEIVINLGGVASTDPSSRAATSEQRLLLIGVCCARLLARLQSLGTSTLADSIVISS